MSDAPIFIVGVPRSGTTLIAAMMASHNRLSCGPETHFFRWLSKTEPEQLVQKDTWPGHAVQFLDSITFSNYKNDDRTSLVEKYELEKTQVEKYLGARNPSIANILSAVTMPFMEKMGKVRWIEKTPDHIMYVSEIRNYFPSSPIIRIIRDPRDVAVSLMKVPWGAKSLLEGLFFWKRQYESSEKFFKEDTLAYSLKYEYLVASPLEELMRLCQFIDEKFEEGMLDTSSVGKKLNSKNVSWKEKASQPLDSSRLSVWRKELSVSENQLAEAFIGDKLDEIGYPREEEFEKLGEIFPSIQMALKHENALYSFASKGIRFWKTHKEEGVSVRIYLGDPADDHWFRGGRFHRVCQVISLMIIILRSINSKNLIYWINETKDRKRPEYIVSLLTMILSPYRQLF